MVNENSVKLVGWNSLMCSTTDDPVASFFSQVPSVTSVISNDQVVHMEHTNQEVDRNTLSNSFFSDPLFLSSNKAYIKTQDHSSTFLTNPFFSSISDADLSVQGLNQEPRQSVAVGASSKRVPAARSSASTGTEKFKGFGWQEDIEKKYSVSPHEIERILKILKNTSADTNASFHSESGLTVGRGDTGFQNSPDYETSTILHKSSSLPGPDSVDLQLNKKFASDTFNTLSDSTTFLNSLRQDWSTRSQGHTVDKDSSAVFLSHPLQNQTFLSEDMGYLDYDKERRISYTLPETALGEAFENYSAADLDSNKSQREETFSSPSFLETSTELPVDAMSPMQLNASPAHLFAGKPAVSPRSSNGYSNGSSNFTSPITQRQFYSPILHYYESSRSRHSFSGDFSFPVWSNNTNFSTLDSCKSEVKPYSTKNDSRHFHSAKNESKNYASTSALLTSRAPFLSVIPPPPDQTFFNSNSSMKPVASTNFQETLVSNHTGSEEDTVTISSFARAEPRSAHVSATSLHFGHSFSRLKLLVNNSIAGGIIGFKGESLRNLQRLLGIRLDTTDRCHYFPGTDQRVLMLAGPSDNVFYGAKYLIDLLKHEEIKSSLEILNINFGTLAAVGIQLKEPKFTVKVVVPSHTCSRLLSNSGEEMQRIEKQCGAVIYIARWDLQVNKVKERLVVVQGTSVALEAAVIHLIQYIQKDPFIDLYEFMGYDYFYSTFPKYMTSHGETTNLPASSAPSSTSSLAVASACLPYQTSPRSMHRKPQLATLYASN